MPSSRRAADVAEGEAVEGPFYNVFDALGLPDAELHQAKGVLRIAISRAMEARGLSQRAAAALVGIPQPNLARVLAGKTGTFDQLFKIWCALGGDVRISFAGFPGADVDGTLTAEVPGIVPTEPAARRAGRARAAADNVRVRA